MKTNYPAIYQITFSNTNKVYIGSTINYKRRKSQHLYKLKTNTHENKKLQNHYNKYGKEFFVFSVLEFLKTDDFLEIRKIEQEYLNKYFAQEFIKTNRKDNRFDKLTFNVSPEVNMEIHYWNEERRLKQIKLNKDRIWSDYSKNKMSVSKKGIPRDDNSKISTSKTLKKYHSFKKINENRQCLHCKAVDINKIGTRFNKIKCIYVQNYKCNICKKKFKIDLN